MKSLIIDSADVGFIEMLATSSGLDIQQVLTSLGLPLDVFDRPEGSRISMFDYVRLIRFLTETTGDETCAGSSRQLRAGTTHYILGSVPEKTLLGDVFKRLAEGYNFVHAGDYNRALQTPSRLSYCIDDSDFPYKDLQLMQEGHSFIESILVSLHILFSELIGTSLSGKVTRVLTKRPADVPSGSFLQFWHAPILFNAEYYAIEYDGRIANIPIKKIDLSSFATIFEAASERRASLSGLSFSGKSWSQKITELIESGEHDQSAIARHLGASVATMRRRLTAEHTSFRDLRAKTLNARARRLLLRGDRVEKVAEELGFAGLRSFSRAFKMWNGITPTVYTSRIIH